MKQSLVALSFLFGILLFPLPSLAATLSVAPSAGTVSTGNIVTVRVLVNPAGTTINNAEAVLHFPVSTLQVLSVSKSPSVFSLWVEDPSFSNGSGIVSFNGGIPNPGVSNPGTVLTITFQAVHAGTASLSLTDGAVRANDGLGTDVLSNSSGATITVTAPQQIAPTQPVTPAVSTTPAPSASESGGALAITSPTNPDQNAWYASPSATFAWTLPSDATAVQMGIDRSPTAVPAVNYAKPISEKTIDALDEGTSYFRMRYRAGGTWSAISTYAIHIDTKTPVITSHDVIYDPSQSAVLVDVSATDEGSGITQYALSLDGAAPIRVASTTFASGAYAIPVRAAGIHRIHITALDAAGNHADTDASFSVSPSLDNQSLFHIGKVGVSLLAVLIALGLITLLSLTLAVLAWLAFIVRRHRMHPEVPTIRKDMHKSFLKMKTNIERDISSLDQARTKRELSREEGVLYRRLMTNLSTLEKHLGTDLDALG